MNSLPGTLRGVGRLGVVVSAVTIALITSGCTQKTIDLSNSGQAVVTDTSTINAGTALSIVTTFPPLYAHVANIADANDTVINLVPAGTSIHTRQPKPSDVVAMEGADVIITNGLGLEAFLDGYLDTLADSGVIIVDTSAGVETIEFEEHEEKHDEHKDEDHEDGHDNHSHEGEDPHIWLDPNNAIVQVDNIVAALSAIDAGQSGFYEQQGDTYITTLKELDLAIKASIADATLSPFIVFHDAYQYFLQAYGLADQQVGLVQEFHGDNPSQQDIAQLIQTIEDNGVATIYTEPQFSPSIVQRLEQETGVTSREIDPIGNSLDNDGYTSMIRTLADGFTN